MNYRDAHALFEKATYYHQNNKAKKSFRLYQEILMLSPKYDESDPVLPTLEDNRFFHLQLSIHNNLANLLVNIGALFEAKAHYRKAINMHRGMCAWCKTKRLSWSLDLQNNLSGSHMNLAIVLGDMNKFDEAKEEFQNAIIIQETVIKRLEYGESLLKTCKNNLAEVYVNFATLLSKIGELTEAKDYLQRAIDLLEDRRLRYVDNKQQWPIALQTTLALTLCNIATVNQLLGDLNIAKSQYQKAIKLLIRIRLWYNDNRQRWPIASQNHLASAYIKIALLLTKKGTLPEAQAQYKKAINLIERARSWCKDDNQLSRSLEAQQTELHAWSNYLLIADLSVIKRLLALSDDCIALFDTYTDVTSQSISLRLLHRMVAFSLKHNEINLAIKLILCAQGRELAYKLEASQLTGNEPEVVTLFVEQREQYRRLLAELAQIPNLENNSEFLAKLGAAKDAFIQSRAEVSAIPEYTPLLSPLNIEVTDIQVTQTQGQATLMWLSFTDDKKFPVNGVLAIPVSGEPQYFDLSDSLERLLSLHDDLAKLMSAGRGYRKNAMDYSEADIQAVIERYTDDSDVNESNVKTPEFVIKQIWHDITRTMREIWQGKNSELGHWLIHHGIDEVLNLTQGKTHNFPLALGCDETIKHRFIPGLALWRQRQALNLGQKDCASHHTTISSQTCAGKVIALAKEDIRLLIPHTALEQKALSMLLSDVGNDCSDTPSRTLQEQSLLTQDSQTAENLFPYHDKPLGFAHIACHGVPDTDKAGGAKLMLGENAINADSLERVKNTVDVAFFNACIAGTTQDDTKGEHHGLLIPLLTKTHQVIASTLPLDDIKASYFAVLLFHYYWREAKPLTESVTLAKATLQTGQWPTLVKENIINIYHQAVDELHESPEYQEHVSSIIQQRYAPIPELCYCLHAFDLTSLDIDHAHSELQANMKALISEQFEQGLTTHLQDSDEGNMAKELLTIFISSIKVFG